MILSVNLLMSAHENLIPQVETVPAGGSQNPPLDPEHLPDVSSFDISTHQPWTPDRADRVAKVAGDAALRGKILDVMTKMGVREPEDALQETLIRVGRPSADNISSEDLPRWTMFAAKRVGLDFLDRAYNRYEGLTSIFLEADTSPGADFDASETRTVLHPVVLAILEKLDERDRKLLVMRHVADYSYDEIGAVFNVGKGTAKNWLCAALRRARERAREQGLGPESYS